MYGLGFHFECDRHLPVKVFRELYVDGGAVAEAAQRLAQLTAHALQVLRVQVQTLATCYDIYKLF